jgi:hypothetical protein
MHLLFPPTPAFCLFRYFHRLGHPPTWQPVILDVMDVSVRAAFGGRDSASFVHVVQKVARTICARRD